MKATEVNILLSSYNDIFSDFDPNSFSERTISDDFIAQSKQIAEHKSGNNMLLRFFLLSNKRNVQEEKVIVTRLSSFFKSFHKRYEVMLRKATKTGLLLTIVGIILMIAASYLSFTQPDKFHLHLLLVLFEPAGWFMLWMGLDHLVYASKDTRKELAFYSKMRNSDIIFCDYTPGDVKNLSNVA